MAIRWHLLLASVMVLTRVAFVFAEPPAEAFFKAKAEFKALFDRGQYQDAQKKGAEVLATSLALYGENHLYTVQVLNQLGLSKGALEQYDDANSDLARALKSAEFIQNDSGIALSLENRATLAVRRGKYDDALPDFERALTLRNKALRGKPLPEAIAAAANDNAIHVDLLELAHAHTGLGRALAFLNRAPEARKHFEEALTIRTAVAKKDFEIQDLASTYSSLAANYSDSGEFGKSREYYEQFLKLANPTFPTTAHTLSNYGYMLHQFGKSQEGWDKLQQAYEILKKRLGEDHIQSLYARNLMGILLETSGRSEEALTYFLPVLEARRRKLGRFHAAYANTLIHLGRTYFDLGRYEEAEKCFLEILEIRKEKPNTLLPLEWGRALCRLAAIAFVKGRDAEAVEKYEAGIAILEKSLGMSHPLANEARHELGIVHATAGDWLKSWKELISGSREYLDWLGKILASGTDQENQIIMDRQKPGFHQLLSLASAHAETLTPAMTTDLYDVVLSWKAANTRTLLNRHEALVMDQAGPEAKSTYRELGKIRSDLAHALLYEDRAASATGRAFLQQRLEELERQLAKETTQYQSIKLAHAGSVAEVQKHLSSGEVVLEFVKYRGLDFAQKNRPLFWGDEQYAVFVVDSKAIRFLPLGKAEGVDSAVLAWRKSVIAGVVYPKKSEARIHQSLWAPIAKVIAPGARALTIIPDSQLALLPFEALHTDARRYLIENYAIRYLASGRGVLPRPEINTTLGAAVIVADPEFGEEPRNATQRTFTRLPGLRNEAMAVRETLERLRPQWKVETFFDSRAEESALRQLVSPVVFYLATHGYYAKSEASAEIPSALGLVRNSHPRKAPAHFPELHRHLAVNSGLALAGANESESRVQKGLSDGLLTSQEAQSLELWGTELVVLSACESDLGEIRDGEGLLGLRHAFELAGAKSVVSSLWTVPDRETELLMRAFFKHWLEGRPKADSLRLSQMEMLRGLRKESRDGFSVSPLRWAGFITHGT